MLAVFGGGWRSRTMPRASAGDRPGSTELEGVPQSWSSGPLCLSAAVVRIWISPGRMLKKRRAAGQGGVLGRAHL